MSEEFYQQLLENEARCPKCGYRDWFTYEGESEDDECFGCMRCGHSVVIKVESIGIRGNTGNIGVTGEYTPDSLGAPSDWE